MTHSIEELERQLQSARDRRKTAQDDERAAEKRLQDARDEASGVLGHVLEFDQSRGFGAKRKIIKRRILVMKVRPSGRKEDGDKAEGRYIVANGSVGVMRGDVLIKNARDLGPYEALSQRTEEAGE